VPPKYSISEAVGFLKGKSAIKIFDMHLARISHKPRQLQISDNESAKMKTSKGGKQEKIPLEKE
jgi:hypothetical protein